ncbi:MAG TPA: histidine kinase [Candidatus Competibacteraceae bacterium]|nr:histidine kinase [Candidatus Competibacteraceae bacterium]
MSAEHARTTTTPTARPGTSDNRLLPDLCANTSIFLIVVISELLALILALAQTEEVESFWLQLAFNSLFIQWIALTSAALLCAAQRLGGALSPRATAFLSFTLIQLVTLLYSILGLMLFDSEGLGAGWHTIWRNLAISGLIAFIALRYLYLQHQWKSQVQAEARARFEALQARIRPHFLFNCLNTIASLVQRDPPQAEAVVLDLADLFRVALRQGSRTTLGEELDVVRRYLAIESLRLGERLQVEWRLAPDVPLDTPIPSLILQPLVENAIYHGIQPRPQGGTLSIAIHRRHDRLEVNLSNPLSSAPLAPRRGQQIAQENIRQRLALAYGEASHFRIRQDAERYSVQFAIPLESSL